MFFPFFKKIFFPTFACLQSGFSAYERRSRARTLFRTLLCGTTPREDDRDWRLDHSRRWIVHVETKLRLIITSYQVSLWLIDIYFFSHESMTDFPSFFRGQCEGSRWVQFIPRFTNPGMNAWWVKIDMKSTRRVHSHHSLIRFLHTARALRCTHSLASLERVLSFRWNAPISYDFYPLWPITWLSMSERVFVWSPFSKNNFSPITSME